MRRRLAGHAVPPPLRFEVQRPVMGIYDRDYYRRDGHSFLGSFTERGTVCKWLIGVNVACFLLQMVTMRPVARIPEFPDAPPEVRDVVRMMGRAAPQQSIFEEAFVLDTDKVWHGQVWRLLTYAFLHSTAGVMHILFNMLFLWWFGSDVEDLYGPREFLAFYLVSAIVGGLVYTLTPLIGLGQHGVCVGASGAVTAVLVLCAIHYPTRIIYLFMFLPVPIWAFVAFSVAQDAFAMLSHTGGQVAVGVHLGGAAFAFAYYKRHWRLTTLLPDVQAWRKRRTQPRLRVYREVEADTPTPVGVPAAPPPVAQFDDEQLEAKMDAVLEKISRVGKENLTDGEREVLRRAAEVFKRRRS